MAVNLNIKAYIQIAETFAPQNGKGLPVTEQRFIKGGHQQFNSFAERDSFPVERRDKDMTCTVVAVSYILGADLITWSPFDRGYLVLNPTKSREPFYVVFPFFYAVLSVTTIDATIHTSLINGKPGQKQLIEITGTIGSVVTYEIARIHVD